MMSLGPPGTPMTLGDTANVFRTNIEQIYGDYPSKDNCPLGDCCRGAKRRADNAEILPFKAMFR